MSLANPAQVAEGPRTGASRYQWMDVSRGLGVILIVIVHAGSIYSGMGVSELPAWIRVLDLALAPYRVPLLVFLSGILLARSLAKGLPRFVTGKVKNLVWPYLIWTALIIAATGDPAAWLNVKLWLGGTVLWYVMFLFIFYAVGLLFARVPFLVIATYALAISMLAPEETKFGSRLFLLMSYFFVGAYAGQHIDRFTEIIRSRWTAALFPIVIGISVYFTQQPGGLKYSPYFAPLVIACIICMCSVLSMFASGRMISIFTFTGRNSLVYYVVHPPLYMLLYNLLFGMGILSPYLCIGLALALGLTVPTVLALCRPHSRAVNYLFEGPDIELPPLLARTAASLQKALMPQYRL